MEMRPGLDAVLKHGSRSGLQPTLSMHTQRLGRTRRSPRRSISSPTSARRGTKKSVAWEGLSVDGVIQSPTRHAFSDSDDDSTGAAPQASRASTGAGFRTVHERLSSAVGKAAKLAKQRQLEASRDGVGAAKSSNRTVVVGLFAWTMHEDSGKTSFQKAETTTAMSNRFSVGDAVVTMVSTAGKLFTWDVLGHCHRTIVYGDKDDVDTASADFNVGKAPSVRIANELGIVAPEVLPPPRRRSVVTATMGSTRRQEPGTRATKAPTGPAVELTPSQVAHKEAVRHRFKQAYNSVVALAVRSNSHCELRF